MDNGYLISQNSLGGANKSRVIQPTGRCWPDSLCQACGVREGWKVFLATFFWSEFLGNGVEILLSEDL